MSLYPDKDSGYDLHSASWTDPKQEQPTKDPVLRAHVDVLVRLRARVASQGSKLATSAKDLKRAVLAEIDHLLNQDPKR